MTELFKFNRRSVAKPPGTLILGEPSEKERAPEKTTIRLINYSETEFEEKELVDFTDLDIKTEQSKVLWVQVTGTHPEVLEKIGSLYNLHPLLLEDITSSGERPKMEDYGDYLFLVVKRVYFDENHDFKIAEIGIVLGVNHVISFQKEESELFKPITERIRSAKGRIRKRGADYLAYSLVDIIVDTYFVVLEEIGDVIETLETALVQDPTTETLQIIHRLKRNLILMRKAVWPLRELLNALLRRESTLIKDASFVFIRDVYDHTIQIIDTIESFRDMVSGMLDIYLSSISNKMNEIMKVLTIIATIFIPLTFIAGVYGMNFQNMPELFWRWGYFMILAIMLGISLFMVYYFHRKKWLG
jgi:magnesium transporter